jgi:hypothetical protein
MFWSLLQHLSNSFPVDLGDPPNEAWIVAWDVHALTTNAGQLLGGNIYYPHSNALIYNDNLLGLLPFALPVFQLSGGNTALTYNVLFLLSFVLCGFTTYLLARYLTRNGAAAFLAGLIVAFCPYRMVHLSHLNQLSGQWLPLCFLFLERARVASRPGSTKWVWPELIGFGVSFTLQFLCSIYYAAFFLVCLLLYLLFYLLREGWKPTGRFLVGITAALAGAALVLLPVISPYLHLQGRVDAVRGPEQVLYFSADLRDFLHMPAFSTFYGWTEAALGVPAQDAHQYLFPGVVVLLLSLIAWRQRKAWPEIWPYALLVPITAVLSLGRQLKAFDRVYHLALPYRVLYDYTPGFHSFRDPARFFYIGFICLALLAAWGLTALLARIAGPVPTVALAKPPTPPREIQPSQPAGQAPATTFAAGVALQRETEPVYAASPASASTDADAVTPHRETALPPAAGPAPDATADRPARGRRVRPVRTLVATLLCLAVLAEYWITPIATPEIAVGSAIPPEYLWLARQPAGTPVLELPIGQQNATIWSEQALMTYYASYHWQPIVNGVGGYTPDGYEADAATLSGWPDKAALDLLRAWHVRYVLWHAAWMTRIPPPSGFNTHVRLRWHDGTILYDVSPS